ncbi:MAG TPA: S8 family peptidase [Chryseosolibacter sp.]|nr:S8 family peptidase [Chryseosolibacter sp.]
MLRLIISLTLILFTLLTSFAQNLKDGVVNVLINENNSKRKLHSVVRSNGRNVAQFEHSTARKIFDKYTVTKFERTYPGIEKYNHPHSAILSRYYTIEGNFNRDRVMFEILKEGADLFEDVEPLTVDEVSFIPNDYNLQTFSNAHLEQIRGPEAWEITKGSKDIKVAIHDPQGFYFNHPDYFNSDGTHKMVYRDESAFDEYFPINGGKSHGLYVATTVAAATDNQEGLSAIGYNTSLMAFNTGGYQMIRSSYDYGADIIVASYTSSCQWFQSEQLMIDMVHDNGTVIVISAGNGTARKYCPSADGEYNGLQYPASYNHVISVGGVTKDDSYFSGNVHLTFNAAVDVTAPGWSVPVATMDFDASGNIVGFDYGTLSGTSLSAPIVGGLAALLLSIEPSMSPEVVEQIIKSTAVNIDNNPGNEIFAGKAGTGRIDAFEAVNRARECFACTETLSLPLDFGWIGNVYPDVASACKIELDYPVDADRNLNYSATRQIVLKPGFSTTSGSSLQLSISTECAFASSTLARHSEVSHETYQEMLLSGIVNIPEDEVASEEPSPYSSVHPNPASKNVVLRYQVIEPGNTRIVLRDFSGNVVDVLEPNQYKEPGIHTRHHDISALPSGIYYYTITSSNTVNILRLVVVK